MPRSNKRLSRAERAERYRQYEQERGYHSPLRSYDRDDARATTARPVIDPGRRLELAPASHTANDRPARVFIDGAWVYVHIHDAEYLRIKADYRRRLAAAHPDRGGSAYDFRTVSNSRRGWLAREVIYYARLGLTPPDNAHASTPGLAQNIRIRAARLLAARNKQEEE